jgi:hypothetical protein
MAVGWHPDLVSGALIGALVRRIETVPIGDELVDGEPNPEYVPPQDITCSSIRTALTAAGIGDGIRDVVFTMAETEGERMDGNARVAVQCVVAGHDLAPEDFAVAQAAETTLRSQIGAVLVAFA